MGSKRHDDDFQNLPRIHPVDLVCIGTKSDPIPLKDVSDNLLDSIKGRYLGHTPLIRTLKEDTFRFTVDKRTRIASRWVMLNVNDEFRSQNSDDQMQFYENHGWSKIRSGSREVTPYEDMPKEPIIAVRIYNGGPCTALVNLA